jgi:CRISPR-associated endonuclease/helicase Cas3
MAENPPESSKDKDFTQFTTDERLFALGFWSKRFFAATVDQFLSFLTHSYSSLCLLPVLADSVIVIDEVHSFSFGMFKNLMSFLENFDIPVLCMTATLPKSRQRQLVELKSRKLQVFSSVADEELEKLEKSDRYILQADIKAANESLKEAHQRGKKTAQQQAIEAYRHKNCILWVVNTVNRCRQIAADLEQKLGVDVLTYHSRFKLKDRQKRHQETVAAFEFQQGERKPVIAVTTQVCEMSLDLDADVLISELAPISSLVQRFGRSNRSSERPKTFRSQVFVYEPDGDLPYHPDELEAARRFMGEVSQQGEVSPWYLADALLRHSPKEQYADGSSSFVDGGYWAISESFRDTDNYSVDAILDSDLEMVKTLVEKHDPDVAGYVLPVPKSYAKEDNRPDWMIREMRYMKIADSNFYCPKRGFGK